MGPHRRYVTEPGEYGKTRVMDTWCTYANPTAPRKVAHFPGEAEAQRHADALEAEHNAAVAAGKKVPQ